MSMEALEEEFFRAVTARREGFVAFVYTKWARESLRAYRSLSKNKAVYIQCVPSVPKLRVNSAR